MIVALGDGQLFFNCTHEAAHAVAAAKLGLPFDYVTVIPNGNGAGHIRRVWAKPVKIYSFTKHGELTVGRSVQNEIVMILAGFSAQKLWFGRQPGPNGADSDFERVRELLDQEHYRSIVDKDAMTIAMQKRADRLVWKEQRWIKRVADTLCIASKIGPDIVSALRHNTKLSLLDGKSEIKWSDDDEPFHRVNGELQHDEHFFPCVCAADIGVRP